MKIIGETVPYGSTMWTLTLYQVKMRLRYFFQAVCSNVAFRYRVTCDLYRVV